MTLWRRRLLAAFMDGLLVLVLSTVLSLVTGTSFLSLSTPSGAFSWELLVAALVVVVLPSVFVRSTPGKHLSELRLLARPGLAGRALVLLKYVLLLGAAMLPWQPYLVLLLILLSALVDGGKRTVLDRVFGTLVERRPPS